MKALCVTYSGLIQMTVADGVLVPEVLVILLVRTFQRHLTTPTDSL